MSHLPFANDPGAGQKHSDLCHYSQAVALPCGTVKCSGQGGWTAAGDLDTSISLEQQIELAFANVDRVLQAAGLRGWEDVYLLHSYHVGDMDASFKLVVVRLRERIPGHRPVWTSISVPRLAFPAMLIELEVEAWPAPRAKDGSAWRH